MKEIMNSRQPGANSMSTEVKKPWHDCTPEERKALYGMACPYCGKQYVDAGRLYVHELSKCRKNRERFSPVGSK